MNIALTGANGFIGSYIKNSVNKLNNVNLITIANNNKKSTDNSFSYEDFFNCNISQDINLFIHLASPNINYEKNDILKNGIEELTKKILKILPKYNCKKFIFFSTSKVYGESSIKNKIYSETSITKPISDYARFKLNAEKIIKKKCIDLKIDFLIYRLPFVYGKKMKSNLSLIFKLIDKSLPVPVLDERINLKKSYLHINIIEKILMENITNHSSIDNSIVNLSDDQPLSITELISFYKQKVNSKSILIKINPMIFNLLLKVPFINDMLIKIYGDLRLNNNKIKSQLKIKITSTREGIVEYIRSK